MKSRLLDPQAWWSIGAVVVAGLVGLRILTGGMTVQSTEISSARAPDGWGYAVLLDIPQDAHGAHSAKVCLTGTLPRVYNEITCTGIAYLSGVPTDDGQLGIQLAWNGPSDLEIRYREAETVYLYHPTFTWPYVGRPRPGYRYLRSLTPIHISLKRTVFGEDQAASK